MPRLQEAIGMRTEKEIREKLNKVPSPEDPHVTSPAYRWGWIDALRWVLEQ
jgi:hypothetical protein